MKKSDYKDMNLVIESINADVIELLRMGLSDEDIKPILAKTSLLKDVILIAYLEDDD